MPLITSPSGSSGSLTWTAVSGADDTISAAIGTNYLVTIGTSGADFGYVRMQLPTAPADGSVIRIKCVSSGGFLEVKPGTGDAIGYSATNASRAILDTRLLNETIVLQYQSGRWFQDKAILSNLNYRSNVLYHFAGSNGGTTITNSGSTSVTATATGTGALTNTRARFGTTSFQVNDSGNGFTIPDNAELELGSNDFTINFWLYTASSAAVYALGKGDAATAAGSALAWLLGTSFTLYSGSTGSTITTVMGPINQWNHYALCKRKQQLRYYLNGVKSAEISLASTFSVNNIANIWQVGYYAGAGAGLTGQIDELQIINGAALFDQDFDPWAFPYSF